VRFALPAAPKPHTNALAFPSRDELDTANYKQKSLEDKAHVAVGDINAMACKVAANVNPT